MDRKTDTPFDERLKWGNEWASQVAIGIEKTGDWNVVPMGAEHIAPSVQRRLSSMQIPDSTAQFIRYFTDGCAVHKTNDRAFFIDRKSVV